MDRRRFIEAGAALVTLTVADIGLAATNAAKVGAAVADVVKAANGARFALGYHNGLANGYWIDAMARPYETVPAQVKVFMLGVQGSTSASATNPLSRFDIDMLYRLSATATAPYRWATLTRNGGLCTSKAITHTLNPDQISGLTVGYDYVGSNGRAKRETQTLPWTAANAPALTPGFYALVGPSAATGAPPSWSALAPPVSGSCLVGRCDGRSNDFDALLIAVEPA
jgi:hypothetical protein